MTIIILGGGYATRLYPMTLGKPKALTLVAGRTLLDRLLDGLGPVDRIVLATSSRFFGAFSDWARGRPAAAPVTILNDRTADDTDKFGATKELSFALEHAMAGEDDIIVVCPDNAFGPPLSKFVDFCRGRPYPVLATYDVGQLSLARNYGVLTLDEDGHAINCVEKPESPASTVVGCGLYYYPRTTVPYVERYLLEGNNPDQPGRFVAWLCERAIVQTWRVPGLWFDVGSKESLAEANRQLA